MEKAATLPILRNGTEMFIAEDPTDVVLVPKGASEASRGPGGGLIRGSGTPRPAQQVKLIHQGGRGKTSGEGGSDFVYDYVIVGRHDAVIKVGDEFTLNGNKFIVDSLDPFNGYEVKAYARQHGKNPSDG
ncbi:head-to-tail stopper [Gordonia phage LilyPad]|nr:head-to-tail stopper [Gordonia phage LilyPad]